MKRRRRPARYRSVDLSRPHDKYFRRVFTNTADAASLLRAYVPEAVARTLRWATLDLLPARFVSSDWHDSESDLLFSVEQEPDATPALLYVLLELPVLAGPMDKAARAELLCTGLGAAAADA